MKKKKYNLALLPKNCRVDVIALSKAFATVADHYQLGEHSLPHVTLAQFYAYDEMVPSLWDMICAALTQNKLPQKIQLVFQAVSFTTSNQKTFYLSLVPNINNVLINMHLVVAACVGEPLNRAYAEYDPHMTLVSTQQKDQAYLLFKKQQKETIYLADEFVLSLCDCDVHGQVTGVICQVE